MASSGYKGSTEHQIWLWNWFPEEKTIIFTTNCILRHQNIRTFLLFRLRTRSAFCENSSLCFYEFIVSKVLLPKYVYFPLENYVIRIFSLDIFRIICIKCLKHTISKKHSITPLPCKTWPYGTEMNEMKFWEVLIFLMILQTTIDW